jgi:tryptophan-rich sensory protein
MIDVLTGFGFFAVVFAAAALGALFRPGAWYDGLVKPTWQPPKWLFAPVWTVLYGMIAIAGWRLWSVAGFGGAGLALGLWALQLALNAAWSPIFFGMKRLDWALADLALLWLAIVATILAARPIDGLATALLLPYLAWVSFAGLLNVAAWRLNPTA